MLLPKPMCETYLNSQAKMVSEISKAFPKICASLAPTDYILMFLWECCYPKLTLLPEKPVSAFLLVTSGSATLVAHNCKEMFKAGIIWLVCTFNCSSAQVTSTETFVRVLVVCYIDNNYNVAVVAFTDAASDKQYMGRPAMPVWMVRVLMWRTDSKQDTDKITTVV